MRTAGLGVVLVASLAVAAASFSRQERDRLEERRLDDVVAVEASVFIVSSSTHPRGGSVDFFATIRNDGPRGVYVKNLTINQDGLRAVQRSTHPAPLVAAGGSVDVGLSIRLDCARRSHANGADVWPGLLIVESRNGHPHEVAVRVPAPQLSSVATTMCSTNPRLFRELSGPLVQTSRA